MVTTRRILTLRTIVRVEGGKRLRNRDALHSSAADHGIRRVEELVLAPDLSLDASAEGQIRDEATSLCIVSTAVTNVQVASVVGRTEVLFIATIAAAISDAAQGGVLRVCEVLPLLACDLELVRDRVERSTLEVLVVSVMASCVELCRVIVGVIAVHVRVLELLTLLLRGRGRGKTLRDVTAIVCRQLLPSLEMLGETVHVMHCAALKHVHGLCLLLCLFTQMLSSLLLVVMLRRVADQITTATTTPSSSITTSNTGLLGHLGLLLLPPRGQAVEQAQRVLRGSVQGHLVLELAALLGKGTHALVNPLVAVDLGALTTTAAVGVGVGVVVSTAGRWAIAVLGEVGLVSASASTSMTVTVTTAAAAVARCKATLAVLRVQQLQVLRGFIGKLASRGRHGEGATAGRRRR